ncbi:hypothetical protein BCR34DRAFT_606363 [Clohesyomyces aquaticus]|uniref:Uncharacterized protein n=1 Tax=Clohesyomyces aquaticus TaxID=1231657 RepID=A0A1Y1YQ59_9PLEO|nr:hypothetical protein BCR34DRAFT_606363 [Clohesyomyces aquaticus]
MALPGPRPSAQALHTIQTAFDRFAATVTPEDRDEFTRTELKDVRNAALRIEAQLASRRSLCNMRRLQPFLAGLERYSKAIDVLCNGTPFLPWAWAPVKLILQISSDFQNAFEKLIEAYGKIADALPRFDRLDAALKHDHNFQAVLALVYTDILDFHRRAYKFVRMKSWKLFFCSMWGHFESRFGSILSSFAYHSELVDKEATAIDVSEASERRKQDAEKWEKQEQEWRAAKLRAVVAWLRVDGDSPEDTLDKLSRECLPGSCDWLYGHPKVELWLKDTGTTALLWLHGKPGAGKSVLCSSLIQNLENRNVKVLYYFCSYIGTTAASSSLIIRSFIIQVIQSNPDLAVFVHDEFMPTRPRATRRALMELLPKLLQSVGSARLVIDGLDEWNPKEQSLILEDVLTFISTNSSSHICKILISSRDVPTISRILTRVTRKTSYISLNDEGTSIERAIGHFIEKRLSDHEDNLKELDPSAELSSQLRCMLIEKANGMFLWVRLVLDHLEEVYSPEDLRDAITNLPSDLTDLYNRILQRICNPREPHKYERARRILKWVSFSRRPLHRLELLHGLALTPDRLVPDCKEIPTTAILELCKPLVEERIDGSIAFVHFSVQEHLNSGGSVHIIQDEAHQDLAFACTTVLLSGLALVDPGMTPVKRLVKVGGGLYRLLPYALEYWIDHVLLYVSSGASLDRNHRLAQHLSRLRVEHDRLLTLIGRSKGPLENPNEIATPNPGDLRLQLLSHLYIHDLIQDVLHFRHQSAQGNCENGKAVEEYAMHNDPTLFNKLAMDFENYVLCLLREDSLEGLSKEKLEAFQSSYASAAFRCRYTSCPRRSFGFASIQLRNGHEAIHFQRVHCKVSACPWSRIGFTNTRALDAHTRNHHSKMTPIPVLAKIRTTKTANGIESGVAQGHREPLDKQAPIWTWPAREEFDQKLAAVENRLAAVYLDKIPPKHVREGEDWFAYFNPAIVRSLDIGLIYTVSAESVIPLARFSSDDRYLAICGNGFVRVFEIQGDTLHLHAELHHKRLGESAEEDCYLRDLRFLSDNRRVVTAGEDNIIRVWTISPPAVIMDLRGHQSDIYSIDISRDDRIIASGSHKSVRVWQVHNGNLIWDLPTPDIVTRVSIAPDSQTIAATSFDRTYVWSVITGSLIANLSGHSDCLYGLEFSPLGEGIISSSLDRKVKMWVLDSNIQSRYSGDSFGGSCIKTFEGHHDFVLSATVSPDEAWVLSGSKDKSVHCWDRSTGVLQFVLVAHSSSVINAVFNAGGTMFVTASGDMRARIWSLKPYTGPR